MNARTLAGSVIDNIPTPERRTRLLGRFESNGEVHQTVGTWSFFDEGAQNRGIGGLKLVEQAIPASERSHRFQLSDRALLFGKLLHDFRVSATREDLERGILATDPATEVRGAFTGGPSQTYRTRQETAVRIADSSTFAIGRHTVRFGVEVRPAFFRSIERQNFGGTYEFASLKAFAAARPMFFRVNRGDPSISLYQHETFVFVQDEAVLAKGVSVTYGVRYGWQSDVNDFNNVAPRLGFAFAPGSRRTVIRGGAGVFHERVTEDLARRTQLFDGTRLVESVFVDPTYPVGSGLGTQPPPSVIRADPRLVAPVLTQASLSVERGLWNRTTLAVEYQYLRGEHLLRSRNLNAAISGQRMDPSLLSINQIESSGLMRSNAVTATVRGAWKRWLTTTAQYTLSHTEDDTSGPFSHPANSYDLMGEWGRSDYDQRHRFQLAGMVTPHEGYRFGVFVTAGSGTPYNVTTGNDDNGDTITTDRPAGLGRNTGEGPGLARVDVRFTRLFRAPRVLDLGRTHTSRNVELSIDAFNLLNHTNYAEYIGVLTSPFFGRSSVALPPRTLQLSIRYKL